MDLQILETGNGGDALLNGNDLKVVDGVENMPYLACFGGAEFWGNNLLLSEVPSSQFLSETEQVMLSVPLNSSGRQAIENAMKRDLQFLLDNVPDTTLNVDVRIVSDNKLECKVDFNGQQFYFLWNPGEEAARVVPLIPPTPPPAPVYDTTATFSSSFFQSFGTPSPIGFLSVDPSHPTGVLSATKKVEFTVINSTLTVSYNISIRVGGIIEMLVSIPDFYIGNTFEYTSEAGTVYSCVFSTIDIYL
jgi:hypothetical protein